MEQTPKLCYLPPPCQDPLDPVPVPHIPLGTSPTPFCPPPAAMWVGGSCLGEETPIKVVTQGWGGSSVAIWVCVCGGGPHSG